MMNNVAIMLLVVFLGSGEDILPLAKTEILFPSLEACQLAGEHLYYQVADGLTEQHVGVQYHCSETAHGLYQ